MPEPPKKRPGLRPSGAIPRPTSPLARRPDTPRSPRGATPAPTAPASRRKLYLVSGGVAGAVVLILLVALSMNGPSSTEKTRREPPEPAPAPAVVKKAPLSPPPEKSRKEIEDEMFRTAGEEQKKFQAEIARKNEEARKKALEAKAEAEAGARKEKEEADARAKEALTGYELRKIERRTESAKHLEEARKAVEDDRKAETARQKALVEKLRNLKLALKLKNGMQLQNVVVQGMTRDEVRLTFTYEGSPVEQAFPVEFIEDHSYIDLLSAIAKGDGAAGQYEMGRHLVLRKLWKDAQSAFQECVKADPSYKPKVPDLARILNNEAAFKGSARRIGADQLFISYDFSDAGQTQDFTAQQPGRIAIEGGELKLQTPGTALYSLKDVEFDHELEVDAIAVFEEKSALVFGAFFSPERKGYLAVVNSQTPAGQVVHRFDGTQKIEQLGVQQAPKIQPGVDTRVRFQAKGGSFKIFVGDQEALALADAAYQKGWCFIGAAGGAIRLKKLTIQGRVNPVEIAKRFAEVEVLVRRALEADLGKKKKKDDSEVDPLSAEDEYLLAKLDPDVRADFEKRRGSFIEAMKKKRLLPPHAALFDDIVKKAPEFAAGHFWRAAALMNLRRPDEARGDVEAAVRLYPEFHEAHLALAQLGLEERNFPAAQSSLARALQLSPGFADAIALGGFLKFLGGDAKAAVADLEVARKLEPESDSIADTQKNIINVLKGPQHLGAKWVKEFPHFLVMTDMSPEKTALYGARLEAAYKFYSETFKDVFAEDPKRPKPRVAIFNTREAYLTYGELTLSGRQEWTLGYFHPLYKELLLFEDVDFDATLQTLYHEAFHQFMSMMIARVPFWYNEGIAEFMGGIKVEVTKKDSKIVERAKILDGRLRGLKMSLNFALKFEDIMMQTPAQFYSGPVAFKYAQAWSMVHFFYESAGGKYRPRIEAYFRKLKEGGTPREAYEAGFGDAPMDELQKEWVEYVKKMELPKK